jgi:hypothetical protein
MSSHALAWISRGSIGRSASSSTTVTVSSTGSGFAGADRGFRGAAALLWRSDSWSSESRLAGFYLLRRGSKMLRLVPFRRFTGRIREGQRSGTNPHPCQHGSSPVWPHEASITCRLEDPSRAEAPQPDPFKARRPVDRHHRLRRRLPSGQTGLPHPQVDHPQRGLLPPLLPAGLVAVVAWPTHKRLEWVSPEIVVGRPLR